MKNTALSHKHSELGAKMVPFAGYNMPVQYEGVNAEHDTVRNGVGVFDVSHMGEFLLKGPNALALIQKVCTNDAAVLFDGKAQYSCMPNGKGGIVDDLIIYRIDAETYFIVVNASNIEKDWNWIASHNDLGVEMQNLSDQYSLLAIQGPKAAEAMQSLTSIDLSNMTYYTFQYGTFAGIENVMVSATGYTGSGGFEVYVKNEDAEKLWDAVFHAGANWGIKPIGLAARDTLRLEAGLPLHGHELGAGITSLQADLEWVVGWSKPTFRGRAALSAEKEHGISRRLYGVTIVGRRPAREGSAVHAPTGEQIGYVTSGNYSPSLGHCIAFVLMSGVWNVGDVVSIDIRGTTVEGSICNIPFVAKK